MKQLLWVCFALITLSSCQFTTGSGNIVNENRSVGNFSAISVGGSIDVEVQIGPVTAVRVEADDNIVRYINTSVSGNTLQIKTESNHGFTNVHMKVYVTTPELNKIKASASSDVVVMDIIKSAGKLSFHASSSASIRAEVDAPEIESDASSSATITLSGRTKDHDAQASSSSEINAFELKSENTVARASSSGDIQVHASVNLDARASSSADIEYIGAAKVNSTTSSSGSVSKKD
ncbi:MAG: DUF2807 domain-containing protein [Chitinophagaceae bacterium]|nr:DUF2807 domain-containing protein [Chitinophagaceae bacterium]